MTTENHTVPRAIGPRIVVERQEADERTPGGIALPDTAKQKKGLGKVVSVGKGRLAGAATQKRYEGTTTYDAAVPVFAPISVEVGDVVCFYAHGGHVVKHQGREYVVLGEEEVLAVMPPAIETPAKRKLVDGARPHKYNREPNADGLCEECGNEENAPIHDLDLDPVTAAERALEKQGIPT